MVNVRMNEYDVIDMLCERVKFWNDDREINELYRNYYTEMVESGCFDGIELDVMGIVDNDCINWTTYGTEEDMMDHFGCETIDDLEERILARYNDLVLCYTY